MSGDGLGVSRSGRAGRSRFQQEGGGDSTVVRALCTHGLSLVDSSLCMSSAQAVDVVA